MYKKYLKRPLDFLTALLALIILLPLFLLLSILGFVIMKGNPFFVQQRPGKNEKIFNLIKFRTLTNERDKEGQFLPADERLVPYGEFLRSSSLDELPELVNILKGDMSVIGPRPLLVKYLPLYNGHQRKRHLIRPGLTGYAQVKGRNSISWEERFDLDVWYVENASFLVDIKIIFSTIKTVFCRSGITTEEAGATFMQEFKGVQKNR